LPILASIIAITCIPEDYQEAPFVLVNDLTDYLRCGNINIGDQLLKLADQEEGLLECPQTRLRLILAIFLCERVDNLFFIWSYSIESGFGQSAD
jgi:hypothetical protein